LLEILRRKGWISNDQYSSLARDGKEIVSMIMGLIKAIKSS